MITIVICMTNIIIIIIIIISIMIIGFVFTGDASELPFDAVVGAEAGASPGGRAGKCPPRLPLLHLRRAASHRLMEEHARVAHAGFREGKSVFLLNIDNSLFITINKPST